VTNVWQPWVVCCFRPSLLPDVVKEPLSRVPEVARSVAVAGGLGDVVLLVQFEQRLRQNIAKEEEEGNVNPTKLPTN
jgi:hypothetical protein